MAVTVFGWGEFQALTTSAAVLNGGKLYTYEVGTTTDKLTYPTQDDAVANTNANADPVVLNSAGRAQIWLDGQYKLVLKTSADATIWTVDEVGSASDTDVFDQGHIAGLDVTLDTSGGDTDHDINVTAGEMRDAADSVGMTLAAEITKQIDAVWALGDDAGGLDTGTVAADTTYYVFLIQRSDTSVEDVLISTSSSAPTMPTNYDKSGVIGQGATDGAANWISVGNANRPLLIDNDGKIKFTGLDKGLGDQGYYARNLLINGDFRLAQRGTTFDATTVPLNSDDKYLLDRWILLSDGNDAYDVTQETSVVPTGSYAAIRLDVETANKKAGILQIIEARDTAAIIDGTVSLSFKARRTGTTINNLRAAVVTWNSTADSPTSDVVSAWNGAGSNPTLATSWDYENVPASLGTLTTSYATFKIENISIDTAGATNVGVFIWIDDVTTTAGDFLYITDVMLNEGAVALDFERRAYIDELTRSKRFHERLTYDSASGADYIVTSFNASTTSTIAALPYQEKRLSEPTVTGSAAGTFDVVGTGADRNASGVTFGGEGRNACQMVMTVGADTAGEGSAIVRDGTDACFIDIDAEL